MPKRHPMKLKDFLKRIKDFGVIPKEPSRGKGSETILFKPSLPGSNQGSRYSIKNRGPNTETFLLSMPPYVGLALILRILLMVCFLVWKRRQETTVKVSENMVRNSIW